MQFLIHVQISLLISLRKQSLLIDQVNRKQLATSKTMLWFSEMTTWKIACELILIKIRNKMCMRGYFTPWWEFLIYHPLLWLTATAWLISPRAKMALAKTRWFALTHSPMEKKAAILKTIFADAFSWMKCFVFGLKFYWSLFLRVQLTISEHRFTWLGAE